MGIQFEEDTIARRYASEETPKLAAWLIRKGFAKTVAGANKLQILIAIVFFALAIYFAF